MKDLTIIILSYNTIKYLDECLESLYSIKADIDIEIIVVDNASTDGSVSMVKKKYPKVKLIESNENLGFGRGNNLGMKVAKGRYVLLLNSDTKITNENIFSEMVQWMDKNKNVGISSCALLNKDGSYQGSGGYFPTLPRVFAWMTFIDDIPFLDKLIKPFHPMHPWFLFKNESYFKKKRNQDWVTGAYFLIRKKVIDKVGYFDKDYFAYVEEVEYCYRAKKSGWEIYYLPQWEIVHYGQVSSNSEFAMLSEYKGLKLFYEKHYSKWKLPILIFFLKMGAVLRMAIFGILKGKEVARIYAKAFKAV